MKYTIRTVAQLTGLSAHTIRAWERRYNVPHPARTEANQRLYEDVDVERLKLLKFAVDSGHAIGQVAHLSEQELKGLTLGVPSSGRADQVIKHSAKEFLARCEHAITRMDAESLEQSLGQAAAVLGIPDLLESVVSPLLHMVGHRWVENEVTIAQEHLMSAVIRNYLENKRTSFRVQASAPRLVVATPTNELHEIGAFMVSAIAAMRGWNVTYLGTNLPGSEIASAARRFSAEAVALSIVYPEACPALQDELITLHQSLGASTSILVGGQGADRISVCLERIGAKRINTLGDLGQRLDEIWSGATFRTD